MSLVWEKEGEPRALPPGAYRVRTTRIERVEDGTHWFVSSTGPKGRQVVLRAGESTRIELDPSVHFEGKARWKGRKLQLAFAIRGEDGRGLSIYRKFKRVPVRYRILGKKGRILAKGRLNYG